MDFQVGGFIIYGYQRISSYIYDPMHSWVGGFIIRGLQWIIFYGYVNMDLIHFREH
jgi:hypothetical protein